MEYKKDPIISFRNTIVGKDKKGADRFQLYLNQEEAQKMIDVLSELTSQGKLVKLDLHVGKRTTNDGTRTFDSAYAFIKETETKGATGQGGVSPTTQGRFVPVANPNVASAIDKLKRGSVA